MPSSEILPSPPGDLDAVDVVTLQDVVQSLLLGTAALALMATLIVAGGIWLVRRRRRVEEA